MILSIETLYLPPFETIGIVKKVFVIFKNYVPDGVAFSRPSRIDCTKSFLESRTGTRFFELMSICDPMGLYMDRNRKFIIQARKSVFPFEFRGTVWCNRFVRAGRMQHHQEHNFIKLRKLFLRSISYAYTQFSVNLTLALMIRFKSVSFRVSPVLEFIYRNPETSGHFPEFF